MNSQGLSPHHFIPSKGLAMPSALFLQQLPPPQKNREREKLRSRAERWESREGRKEDRCNQKPDPEMLRSPGS